MSKKDFVWKIERFFLVGEIENRKLKIVLREIMIKKLVLILHSTQDIE